MSTRSAVARKTGEETFAGRYIHFDGQPSGVGYTLWEIYHDHFARDLDRMLAVLIDEHPAGWSSIDGVWDEPIGYSEDQSSDGPTCYCHGDRNEPAEDVTDENGFDMGLDFAYVFDTKDGRRTMQVLTSVCHSKTECIWSPVRTIDLDRRQPNWERLDDVAKDLAQRRYRKVFELGPEPTFKANVKLAKALRKIKNVHSEVTDIRVRERIGDAIEDGFFVPVARYALPQTFGMLTPQGDAAVRAALEAFLPAANAEASAMKMPWRLERSTAFIENFEDYASFVDVCRRYKRNLAKHKQNKAKK